MRVEEQHLAVKALSWIRQDNFIRVPHPVSNRLVYLSNEQADVFERIDDGLATDEILDELKTKYEGFSRKKLQDIVAKLRELDIVVVPDQFG